MKYFCSIFLILLFVSCQDNALDGGFGVMSESTASGEADYEWNKSAPGASGEYEVDEQSSDMQNTGPNAAPGQSANIKRKIIRTAQVRLRVEDVEQRSEQVKDSIAKYQGYISSMNMNNTSYSTENQITIRVPAEHFDALLAILSEKALHIDYRRINASDVTERYYDLETRLATKKEVRDRYIEVLRTKARTATEILEAEDKIRVVQEEIESVEGRLRYLKNQIALCTINLELYQLRSSGESYEVSYGSKIKRAFENGWSGLLNFVVMLVYAWPFLLIAIAVIWGINRWRRNRKNKS